MSAGVERTYAAVQTAAVQRASGAGVLAQAGGCDGRPGLAGGGWGGDDCIAVAAIVHARICITLILLLPVRSVE
jgi:hypothetical protein